MKPWIIGAVFALLTASFSAQATEYTVDSKQSRITFSGEHAENQFKGEFKAWHATILFDAKHLESSALDVSIDTGSAETGNRMYDETLPTKDWFDSEQHPQARFKSTSITRAQDGSFVAKGELTIRNIVKPIMLPFTLEPNNAESNEVHAKATLKIDRLAFAIGKESDEKAEWVSRDIGMQLYIVALKK